MTRRSRIIRRLVLVVALISTAAVVIFLPPPWQDDDIREAVFRHMFAHNGSALQQHAGSYYLAVGPFGLDPSDGFLKRFRGCKPAVRKVAECESDTSGVTSIRTRQPGLLFRVTFIRRVGVREFEAKGGYYEDGLSSSGNTYRVRLVSGRWTVVQDRMDWISCLGIESPGYEPPEAT